MEMDNRKQALAGSAREMTQFPEESMEDWFTKGVGDIEEGEVVRGRVVEVRSSEVLVDIGYKSEGAIPIEEFRHSGPPKVGDEIEVYLEAKEDSEGLIVLSKDKADKIKVWDAVSRSFDSGAPVEGRVVEVVKGGLAVDVGVRAFLPGSQVDLRPVKNLASMMGQTIRAKVIKLNRRRGNVVLSRRAVLEEDLDLVTHLGQRAVPVELLDRDRALALVADVHQHLAAADVHHTTPDELALLELAGARALLEPVLHAFLGPLALHARLAEVPARFVGRHAACSSVQWIRSGLRAPAASAFTITRSLRSPIAVIICRLAAS